MYTQTVTECSLVNTQRRTRRGDLSNQVPCQRHCHSQTNHVSNHVSNTIASKAAAQLIHPPGGATRGCLQTADTLLFDAQHITHRHTCVLVVATFARLLMWRACTPLACPGIELACSCILNHQLAPGQGLQWLCAPNTLNTAAVCVAYFTALLLLTCREFLMTSVNTNST